MEASSRAPRSSRYPSSLIPLLGDGLAHAWRCSSPRGSLTPPTDSRPPHVSISRSPTSFPTGTPDRFVDSSSFWASDSRGHHLTQWSCTAIAPCGCATGGERLFDNRSCPSPFSYGAAHARTCGGAAGHQGAFCSPAHLSRPSFWRGRRGSLRPHRNALASGPDRPPAGARRRRLPPAQRVPMEPITEGAWRRQHHPSHLPTVGGTGCLAPNVGSLGGGVRRVDGVGVCAAPRPRM